MNRQISQNFFESILKDEKLTEFESDRFQYQTINDIEYCYRVKTENIFEKNKPYIFEFYILDDPKFQDYYLFKNIWRETLLMKQLKYPLI